MWKTATQTILIAAAALAASVEVHAAPLLLYVATDGNDAWSGKLDKANAAKTDGPFATLERARDEIRKVKRAGGLPEGGVTVTASGGIYERQRPFELAAQDSGTQTAPVVYRARPGQTARLLGGRVVTGFAPVTDAAVVKRLAETARGKVVRADLRALGISEYGGPAGGGMELFFRDKPMTVARWPNEGFVRIADIVVKDGHKIHGRAGSKTAKFVYEGDRPKRWADENEPWLHGYWFWDWSEQRQRIKAIDTEKRQIELTPPYHGYGYRKGQWYYAFNMLCEIDAPGEWYVDRKAGLLYFWPPAAVEAGSAIVSVSPTLVTMKDVSHVTLRGFYLEAARGTAVGISGGAHATLVGCTIRNVGGGAVSVSGGQKHGVVGCDVTQTGCGGISLNGGDRKTLTPAGHYAENNHIHHYSRWRRVYQPGISLNGVGNRAAHNLIHNAPHMGMGFGGNDHVIEFNEFHSVCYESNDAGAIYTGRNWTMRGTIIRHNYMHHINGFEGKGCVGVYLDDMFCGTQIVGNVFYQVTRAAMIGGGRDCTIENNIFVDCSPSVHVDSRALGWAHGHADMWIKEGREKGTLSGIRYNKPPYSERYPKLVGILDDNPAAPKGNVIARNVCQGGRWDAIDVKAKPLVTLKDNLLKGDPRFVDAKNLNFQLREDSPAYKLGFKRIPIEKIGLYKDDRRASWPVRHEVRKSDAPPAAKGESKAPSVFKVPQATAAPKIDGTIEPAAWQGADRAKAMVVAQGIRGDKKGPESVAWLVQAGAHLFVAIDSKVDASKPIAKTNTWGQDDAVEIALRNPAAGRDAPIFVFRGYPNGQFESSTEAGAPESAARKAREGAAFGAKILGADRWTAEWRIRLSSLGIHPKKHTRLAFNLTVRKSAEPAWIMWRGTGGNSWLVDRAGVIELAR